MASSYRGFDRGDISSARPAKTGNERKISRSKTKTCERVWAEVAQCWRQVALRLLDKSLQEKRFVMRVLQKLSIRARCGGRRLRIARGGFRRWWRSALVSSSVTIAGQEFTRGESFSARLAKTGNMGTMWRPQTKICEEFSTEVTQCWREVASRLHDKIL